MLNSNAWPRDLSSNVRFEMYRNANQLRTKKYLDFHVSKIFFIEINMDIWNAAQMIEKFITKSTKNGFFWWRTMKKAIVEMNLGKSTIVSVLLQKIYEMRGFLPTSTNFSWRNIDFHLSNASS